MAAKKKIDWDRIEPQWRAGIKSVLQLAADYEDDTGEKVSHTAINKHFKTLGVPRDLSAKVQAKADAIVSAAMVSGVVSTETTVSDAKIINETAEIVAVVKLSQRNDIQRSRKLVMQLLSELEGQTENLDLYEHLAELLIDTGDDDKDRAANAKRWEAFNKAISLGSRAGTMKQLADSLKTLVTLEREAYGIAEAQKIEMTGKLEQNVNHTGTIEHRSVSEIGERIAELLGVRSESDSAPSLPN